MKKNLFKSLWVLFVLNSLFQIPGKTNMNKNMSSLNGTYTVGAGGDFATIADAFAAFNAEPITGPVVFLLTDETYMLTSVLTLNANSGSSADNTLVIKPAPGKTVTIKGVILLNGVSYFTLDGSNSGTDTRDLTLQRHLQITSTAENSCNHITIKNTIFRGTSTPPANPAIEVSGPLPNRFFTAENNQFTIYISGIKVTGNTGNPNTGYIIRKNDFNTLESGVVLSSTGDFQVIENNFTNLQYGGISIAGNSSNGMVYNNKISWVSSTKYSADGIYLASTNASSDIIIYNNFITTIANFFTAAGIRIKSGGGYKIYHNTLYIGTFSSIGISTQIYVDSGVQDNAIDLRNNILDVSITDNGGSMPYYFLIYSLSPKTVFSHIDYNIYHSTHYYGYIQPNPTQTFNDFITAFGDNAHSVSAKPVYMSATDPINLHLPAVENSGLRNLGTPLPEVTADIDGDTRNPLAPDIGADEFSFALAVENTEKKNIKLYPNPVTDNLHLLSDRKMETAEIVNASGQLVSVEMLNTDNAVIDMGKFPAGLYLLKIREGKDIRVMKVIKK